MQFELLKVPVRIDSRVVRFSCRDKAKGDARVGHGVYPAPSIHRRWERIAKCVVYVPGFHSSFRDFPDFLYACFVDLRDVLRLKTEPFIELAEDRSPRSFSDNECAGIDLQTRFRSRFFLPVFACSLVIGTYCGDPSLLDDWFHDGSTVKDRDAQLFSLSLKPAAELRYRNDQASIVTERFGEIGERNFVPAGEKPYRFITYPGFYRASPFDEIRKQSFQ